MHVQYLVYFSLQLKTHPQLLIKPLTELLCLSFGSKLFAYDAIFVFGGLSVQHKICCG